jgi:hypothetical protein
MTLTRRMAIAAMGLYTALVALAFTDLALIAFSLATSAGALPPPCPGEFKAKCFGVESLDAELSTSQAGAHPDLTFSFGLAQDPDTAVDSKGLYDTFVPVRNVRTDVPPGLIGDPSVLGLPQQCRAAELALGECPNGSQIGLARIDLYKYNSVFVEPLYMMIPPGGDVIARVGFVGGIVGTNIFADATLRSESDYGLSVEIIDAATVVHVVGSKTTLWGVPAAKEHDTERCTPGEVFKDACTESPPRPPGSRELPFTTNPTRCGVPLEMSVSAASWAEPERFDTKTVGFPQITGCNKLPYGPGLTIEPTNRRAAAPSGLDVTLRVPASEGVKVLEPSQTRDARVLLPEGVTVNPGAADGLDVCSEDDVNFGERVAAECPDAAKLAGFEVEIPALPRRLKGAVYLREPEPGNLYRFWAVADDLGAHIKLQGQLNIDEQTGQLETTILDIPQAPVREMKLVFKSGFRAPLINPPACGTYDSLYEFVPWSGGPPQISTSAMTIDEGCEGLGGFSPKLSAGSTDPQGGTHSPFTLTLTREDGEQNLASLEVSLPRGLAATFAGIPRCEGTEAETGQCPAESRVGRVTAAVGAGRMPLWVPQPGKRPTAVYLGGPYKGGPLSVISVVPAQAGPFDLGDQVVRTAIYVDPVTAQATAKSDPLPQILEGVPVRYRTANVFLDRPGFSLNPTSCARKETTSVIRSDAGSTASPSSPFAATDCDRLDFKPSLSLRLRGGTHRGSHPKLHASLQMPAGGANVAATSVALPHSEFLDQAHIRTVCTRVQFAAKQCPDGSIYGTAKARSPLLDETLEGSVYLRSSDHPLPDVVIALKGPPSLPIEVDVVGRVDSVNGGIRTTFETVPDAPVSEFTLDMQGGKKGLIVNSTNLCASVNRATAKFTAQNGKQAALRPALKSSCRGSKRAKR